MFYLKCEKHFLERRRHGRRQGAKILGASGEQICKKKLGKQTVDIGLGPILVEQKFPYCKQTDTYLGK